MAELDEPKFIDKRHLLWWQLGFEGRRIVTEEEFKQGLKEVTYPCVSVTVADFEAAEESGKAPPLKERTFRVWMPEFIPILLRTKRDDQGRETTFFVTVKPISQEVLWTKDPEEVIRIFKEVNLPLSANLEPHARGVAVEVTNDFVFWHSILMGYLPQIYGHTRMLNDPDLGVPILLDPVNPERFYKNLIDGSWSKGKRPQKQPESIDLLETGFELVPYYEFDPKKNQIMIYPTSVFPGRLDLPAVVRGDEKTGIPVILGAGFPLFYIETPVAVLYWEFSDWQKRAAKESLIERLGIVRRQD